MFTPDASRARGPLVLVAAAVAVAFLAAAPLRAVEPEDNTLLDIYRQVDRQVVSPPTNPTPPNGDVSTPKGMDFPDLSLGASLSAPTEWEPPRVTAQRRDVSLSEALNPPALSRGVRVASDPRQVPVLAVIDMDSDTLDPAALLTLTRLVWSEVQRAGRTRLLELDTSRHILARNDMTPSDPYRLSPSRHQLAAALNSDYLVLGDINHVENTFVAELVLYSASSNSILNSVIEFSSDGFEGLLRGVPDLVEALLKVLPELRAASAAERGDDPTGRNSLLGREVRDLRRENERLRQRVTRLQQALAGASSAQVEPTPTPYAHVGAPGRQAHPIDPRIVSVRPTPTAGLYDLPPVKGAYKKTAAAKKKWVRETHPTPVSIPTPAPEIVETPTPMHIIRDEPTPEPKIAAASTPRPTRAAAPPTATPPQTEAPPTAAPTSAPLAPPDGTGPTPGSPEAKERARKYYNEGRYNYPWNSRDALEPLGRAVELDPTNEDYQHALVTRLYYTEDFSTCARKGEMFAARGAKNPEIHIFTGAAYTALGKYQEALVSIDRTLQLDPNNAYALYNRAMNLYYLNDPRATEAFRRYLQLAKDDPEQARFLPRAQERLAELEGRKSQ